MNLAEFLKQTLERLKAYSPDYFIKLRKIAGWITALALILNYLPAVFNFFDVTITFSATMLSIVAVCGKIWKLFAVVFGFTWLPADWSTQPKYAPHQIVYLKKTNAKLTITNMNYETSIDTKTSRKERAVLYDCSDGQKYYEIELTDMEPVI